MTVLAWGDSVTACGFLPDADKWQEVFVRRLREKFPKSEITLVSNGWSGRTTRSFLAEPEGALHNYTNTVLDVRADRRRRGRRSIRGGGASSAPPARSG